MPTQGVVEGTKTPNPAHFIQVPPLTSSPTCIADLSAISIGPGFGLGDLDAIAIGQVDQDHSAANIVMTFLVQECYGSPKKHEF
jgi:hypothetical protein